MNDDQLTPTTQIPTNAPAITGQDVADTAKDVLSREPAMSLGSPAPVDTAMSMPQAVDPTMDMPASVGESSTGMSMSDAQDESTNVMAAPADMPEVTQAMETPEASAMPEEVAPASAMPMVPAEEANAPMMPKDEAEGPATAEMPMSTMPVPEATVDEPDEVEIPDDSAAASIENSTTPQGL